MKDGVVNPEVETPSTHFSPCASSSILAPSAVAAPIKCQSPRRPRESREAQQLSRTLRGRRRLHRRVLFRRRKQRHHRLLFLCLRLFCAFPLLAFGQDVQLSVVAVQASGLLVRLNVTVVVVAVDEDCDLMYGSEAPSCCSSRFPRMKKGTVRVYFRASHSHHRAFSLFFGLQSWPSRQASALCTE